MTGDDIVAAARDWIGTPYRHQASVKGAGADCLGLVRGLWRGFYGAEAEAPPPYSRDWAEIGGQEALLEAAMRNLVPRKGAARPGDLLLFRLRDGAVAKHLGILTKAAPVPAFVHAYDRHGVIESPLSQPWARRVVGCFAFPGRTD